MKTIEQRSTAWPHNARVWLWYNDGWVKLTVKPGQLLHAFKFSRDAEGYSRQWTEWEWRDGVLTEKIERDARDCDGHISESHEWHASADRLRAERVDEYRIPSLELVTTTHNGAPIFQPHWIRGQCRIRDHSAEDAGY